MNRIQTFFGRFSTPVIEGNALQTQRERILFNILVGMSILGLFLLGAYIIFAIPQGRWLIIFLFVGVYAWTLTITFVRRLPFSVRVYGLSGIMYVLGLVTLLSDGLQGNGRIYLLTFTVITGILMGWKAGAATMGMSLATIGLIWGLIGSGRISPEILDTNDALGSAAFWVVALVSFLATTATTTISMGSLLSSLERTLTESQGLARALQTGQEQLEKNVADRTQDLERRLVQIRTAAEITNAVNTYLDPQELIQQVVDLIRERFGLYYVGIFLLDEAGEYAVLRAGTGDAGKQMVAERHRLAAGGTSMIGWTVSNRKARIALDVGSEAVRFSNPYLPQTRSELALPLIRADRVLGAMTVQSDQPEAFDEDDITALQSLADSLGTAIENGRLFQELGQRLEEIHLLHQSYLTQAWSETTRRGGELSYTYQSDRVDASTEGQASLEIPLLLREQSIGQIVLENANSAWTEDEKSFVRAVTAEAAVALESARLLGETQRRVEREKVVSELTNKVRTFTEVETVMQAAIREVGQLLKASGGVIVLHGAFDDKTGGEENGDRSQ